MTEWPFPISASGELIDMDKLDQLAIGVQGYAIEDNGCAYIPLIIAEREGAGDVGRFLDSLPAGVKVPNVTSHRLRSMLTRRGFKMAKEDGVDVWTKP